MIENPAISIPILNELQEGLVANTLCVKDYENISIFLNTFDMNEYIFTKMRSVGFYNYQDFINYRNQPIYNRRMAFEEGFIIGIIKQCIKMLIDKLK